MSSSEEIYGKVARVLAEPLNVDEDDLTPAATLQGDLGAESIDFLDIVFRLEREFGINVPRGELFPESVFQGDPDFVRGGSACGENPCNRTFGGAKYSRWRRSRAPEAGHLGKVG